MLKQVRIENFKPVRGEVSLPLRPVTVLAGLNSSGKSTVLQSLLALSQTLTNATSDKPLVLNGNPVQLGTFPDVHNERATDAPHIGLGFSLELERTPPDEEPTWQLFGPQRMAVFNQAIHSVDLWATFEAATPLPAVSAIEALRIALGRCTLTIRGSDVRGAEALFFGPSSGARDVTITTELKRMTAAEQTAFVAGVTRDFLRLVPYAETDNYLAEVRTSRPHSEVRHYLARLNHFLPESFVGKYSLAQRQLAEISSVINALFFDRTTWEFSIPDTWRAQAEKIGSHRLSDHVLREVRDLARNKDVRAAFQGQTVTELMAWARSVPLMTRRKAAFTNQIRKVVAEELIPLFYGSVASEQQFGLENVANDFDALYVYEGVRAISNFFSSRLRYIGPLRADPLAVQRFAPSSEADDVGTRGEFAAAVYDANRQQTIPWWHPQELKVTESPLSEAVDVWLRHLGVAHGVSTREGAVPGVAWQIQHLPGSASRPLAAVGVGVSQVLPIVVAGLLAPRGAILLIEQPELHLHPRAQAKLGDFFLGLSNVEKQCVIETHSDAFVNQLRLALVKGGPPTLEKVEIYFVSQQATGEASFAPVEITETGRIRNWPSGFFDETAQQEDAITRAGLLRRSAKPSSDA